MKVRSDQKMTRLKAKLALQILEARLCPHQSWLTFIKLREMKPHSFTPNSSSLLSPEEEKLINTNESTATSSYGNVGF